MTLTSIIVHSFGLALSAVGGAFSLLPTIALQHWTTPGDLATLAAIAQATPGPNMLLITLVGWRNGGWLGAIAATIGFCLPSALVILALYGHWNSFVASRWRTSIQAALAPLAVGMVLAGAFAFSSLSRTSGLGVAITLCAAFANLKTKIPPIFLIAAGAVAGLGAIYAG